MTRTRRTKGLMSAVLGCALCLPTLAIFDAGPARAANTAAELLVDPTDRVVTAETDGVRPFAGKSRYETAVLLAERLAYELGGSGSVSSVILVSGEKPADGAIVAGLAGRERAAVLLTFPDQLPKAVGAFINRHVVSEVIVVGGTGSVSDRVLREVAALEVEPTIRRISGADRYATAAAVATELDSHSMWCGTGDTVAVLTNGNDDRLVDAAAISPLAFARELPILLTRSGELPAAAARYLQRQRTERVVIFGGTSVVSDAVVSDLLEAGVDEVERVAARTATPSESTLAQLMTVTCRHELEPAQGVMALVSRDSVFDAIAAGPMLATGLDGSGFVPMLMVSNPLPRALQSILSRTPREVDSAKNHLLVVAVGGVGAVPEAVMNSAVNAAASARALTARIRANAGDSTLRISYSERLEVDVGGFIARLRDLLYVNGVPASIASQPQTVSTDPCATFSSLDVTLRHELQVGDRIELEAAEDWHSTEGDRREIRGASRTIPEPRPSFRVPSIEVIALPGQSKLWITVRATQLREPGASAADDLAVNPGRIRVIAEDDETVTVGGAQLGGVEPFLGAALYSFDLSIPGGGNYELAKGDVVVVSNGAVIGAGDRRSAATRRPVTEITTRLGVAAVRAGPPNPGVDDSVTTTRPDEIPNVSKRAETLLGDKVRVVGKWTGGAAGAAGNAWQIYNHRAAMPAGTTPTPGSDAERPATQIGVDATRQLVSIRHIDAPEGEQRVQTYGELLDVLNGNRDFSRHFVAELVESEPCEGDEVVVDLDDDGLIGTVHLAGGLSSVSFLVTFNDYVSAFEGDGSTVVDVAGNVGEVIDDILGGLITVEGGASADYSADGVQVATHLPGKQVFFRFTTANPAHTIGQVVSLRGNRVEIRKDIARNYREDDRETEEIDESANAARFLFVVSSRGALLLTDLPAP